MYSFKSLLTFRSPEGACWRHMRSVL